jgi:hypothetical protein
MKLPELIQNYGQEDNLFPVAAPAAGVYLPEGRHHSRCEQSELEF